MKRKATSSAANEKPEKKLMNSTASDFSIDFSIKEKFNLKICLFNVAGLRSCVNKGCVEYFQKEDADIICLNVSYLKYNC
jgi:AP endonuclease-1